MCQNISIINNKKSFAQSNFTNSKRSESMNFISSVGWKVWTSEQLIKVCLFSQSSFIFIWWYLHNKPPTSQHREVAQMNNGRRGRWYKHYNEIQYFWYNAKHIWLWVWTRSEPCVVTILRCCSLTTHNILFSIALVSLWLLSVDLYLLSIFVWVAVRYHL